MTQTQKNGKQNLILKIINQKIFEEIIDAKNNKTLVKIGDQINEKNEV